MRRFLAAPARLRAAVRAPERGRGRSRATEKGRILDPTLQLLVPSVCPDIIYGSVSESVLTLSA